MKIMPHVHRGRFYNDQKGSLRSYLTSVLHTLRYALIKRKPFFNQPADEMIASWTAPLALRHEQAPSVTWLGHATCLITMGGYTIMTDPLFFDIPLFKRQVPFPINPEQLPNIDVIVISHNHHDHLDHKSLRYLLKHNPLVYVPIGDKKIFERYGFTRVHECMWWDTHTLPVRDHYQPVQIQFLPAHHWSGRSLYDMNRSLWGSWLFSSDSRSVYFGGDTAMSNHFSAIHRECGPIDIALLPIGPCEPEAGMLISHMNPEQALQAQRMLEARVMLPIHWGTFRQGHDTFLHALTLLEAAANQEHAQSSYIKPLFGKTYRVV